MSAVVDHGGYVTEYLGPAVARTAARAGIGLAVFSGGFVMIEPAPYDLIVAALLAIWFLFGLRIPQSSLPLVATLTLFVCGGVLSSMLASDWSEALIYVLVTGFLAISAVFFAALIAADMGRIRLIFRAYTLAAVVTATLGIIGYFAVPGFEGFQRYSRAMGAFQDPNVFGPFLVAPVLYLAYGLLNRSAALLPVRGGLLLVLLFGILLSFSRAAWGLTVLSVTAFYVLLIINEPTARMRLKYIVLGTMGCLCVLLTVVVALQVPEIAKLFTIRVLEVQDYDVGHFGRFARHLLGFQLALERPLGIGPLQFRDLWGEDPHNIFLKSLMAYGWLGFVGWVGLTVWTITAGFKMLFRPRPWLPYFQIAYIALLGHIAIGYVIDTDHWRHYFLLLGIVWGCIGLERKWQGAQNAVEASTGAPPRQSYAG